MGAEVKATTDVFGSMYAESYDLLYGEKDYEREGDVLEDVFRQYGKGDIKNVLDLGCGTGNHAIVLARRGYQVTGVDISPEMLSKAERKAIEGHGKVGFRSPKFFEGDIRTIDLGQRFDAVLMMFAVLGYQQENHDVLYALKTARTHLRPEGLLIFDVWYGPAVLAQRPTDRLKVIPIRSGQILRFASGELDTGLQICTVHYRLWHVEGGRMMEQSEETHRMRFFFPQELNLLIEFSGFSALRLGAFPEFRQDADETTWNAIHVSRAV
jgi:SAM-dependent methyltransferase